MRLDTFYTEKKRNFHHLSNHIRPFLDHRYIASSKKPLIFHDESYSHKETRPLTCYANQRADFYMIGTSVMKELYHNKKNDWRKIWGF